MPSQFVTTSRKWVDNDLSFNDEQKRISFV